MPVRIFVDGEIKIVGRGSKPVKPRKKAEAAPAEAIEKAALVAETAEEATE